MEQSLAALPPGSQELPNFEFDTDEINKEIARMPRRPDENLK